MSGALLVVTDTLKVVDVVVPKELLAVTEPAIVLPDVSLEPDIFLFTVKSPEESIAKSAVGFTPQDTDWLEVNLA